MAAGGYTVSGDASELLAQYEKLRTVSQDTMDGLMADAIAYSDKSKEQIKYINEQAQALERLNKVKYGQTMSTLANQREAKLNGLGEEARNRGLSGQAGIDYIDKRGRQVNKDFSEDSRILREQYAEVRNQSSQMRAMTDTIRLSGKEEILDADKNTDKLKERIGELRYGDDPQDHATAAFLQEHLDKNESKQSDKPGMGLLATASLIDLFKGAMKAAGQLAQSQNGYDMIRPAVHASSSVAGGIVQGGLETALGIFFGKKGDKLSQQFIDMVSTFGGQAVKEAIDIAGEVKARNMESTQELLKTTLQTAALTGRMLPVGDLSGMGSDYAAVSQKQTQIASRYGSAENLGSRTQEYMSLNKGMGVDEGTLMEFIDVQRNTTKTLASTFGGIFAEGSKRYFTGKDGQQDRSFFPEFAQKFLALQKEFLKSSTTVKDGSVYNTLAAFDEIGGQWKTKDYRSAGNVMSVQQGLSNPNSDAMKALSYSVLRELHPNMGIADLNVEMEKGVLSEGYIEGMMKKTKEIFGEDGDQATRLSFSKMFTLSAQASKEFYEGKDGMINEIKKKAGNYSQYQQEGSGYFSEQAQRNTNDLEAQAADIKNGIIRGGLEGAEALAEAFLETVAKVFSGVTINTLNGEVSFGPTAQSIKGNSAKVGNAPDAIKAFENSLKHTQAYAKEQFDKAVNKATGKVKENFYPIKIQK